MNTTSFSNATTLGPAFQCPVPDRFALIVGATIPTIISILGILGNTLSFLVLLQDKYPGPTFYSLRFLACSDTALLLSALVGQGIPFMCFVNNNKGGICYYHEWMKMVFWPVVCTAQLTTIYLTILISLERYIAICHPLQSRKLCTIPKVRLATIVIITTSCVYNIPKYFEFKLVDQTCDDVTKPELEAQPLRSDVVYRYLYNTVLHCLLSFAIPTVTLAFLNINMALEMRKARQHWKELNRKRRREVRTAVIPFVIVIVFFVTNILQLISYILDAAIVQWLVWLQHFTGVVNLFVMLNSALNFVIFYLFGSRFRLLLYRTLKGAMAHSNSRLTRKGAQVEHTALKPQRAFVDVHAPPTPVPRKTSFPVLKRQETEPDQMRRFLDVPRDFEEERRSSCKWSEFSENSDDITPSYAIKV